MSAIKARGSTALLRFLSLSSCAHPVDGRLRIFPGTPRSFSMRTCDLRPAAASLASPCGVAHRTFVHHRDDDEAAAAAATTTTTGERASMLGNNCALLGHESKSRQSENNGTTTASTVRSRPERVCEERGERRGRRKGGPGLISVTPLHTTLGRCAVNCNDGLTYFVLRGNKLRTYSFYPYRRVLALCTTGCVRAPTLGVLESCLRRPVSGST